MVPIPLARDASAGRGRTSPACQLKFSLSARPPLACHAGAAREPRRRLRRFPEDMEVAVARLRVGLHGNDRVRLEAQSPGGGSRLALLADVAPALPGHQVPAEAKERGPILGDHRQRTDGARRHQIARLASLGPFLDPGTYDGRVEDAGLGHRTGEEPALAVRAL